MHYTIPIKSLLTSTRAFELSVHTIKDDLIWTREDAAEGHVFPSMGLAVFHPILDLIEERIKPRPPDHQ